MGRPGKNSMLLAVACATAAPACVPRPLVPPSPACLISAVNSSEWKLVEFQVFTMRVPPRYDGSFDRAEVDLPGVERAMAFWHAGPGRLVMIRLGGSPLTWPRVPELQGHSECEVGIGDRRASITSGWDGRGYVPPSNIKKYVLTATWEARRGRVLVISALTPNPREQDTLLAMFQSVRIKPDTNPILSADESLWHSAARGRHFHDGTPDSIRARLLAPAATGFFIDLLKGNVSVRSAVRTPPLYWVAEAADLAALPVLLEHSRSRDEYDMHIVDIAQYGLARLAPDAREARRRLEEIATTGARRERHSLVRALRIVNDETAHSILRLVRVDDLPEETQTDRHRALNAPPWPRGEGRMFCRANEKRRMSPEGLFPCVPAQ